MKKWLVGVLVLVAVIVLVSPGIVGLLTERSLQQAVNQADSANAEIVVTTERFDRDWFTSAGSHRVQLRSGDLYMVASDFARQAGEDSVPALIINTEVEHGIVPLGNIADDDASLMPALARSMSTMQLQTASARVIDLPGTLRTEIGLTGSMTSHYVLEAGSADGPTMRGRWSGANLLFSTPASGDSFSISGTVDPWSLESEKVELQFGALTIDAEVVVSAYGFNVGSLDLDAGRLSVTDASDTLDLRDLKIVVASTIDDGRLSGESRFELGNAAIPGIGAAAVQMQLTTAGIDALALQALFDALEEIEASSDPNLSMDDIDSYVEPDMQLLLTRGGAVRVEQLTVTLPQGTMSADFTFELPESDLDEAKSWAGLALLMDASIDFRIDDPLLRFAQSMNPDLASLIVLGYLRPDNGTWKLHAEIADGIFTINGAPMAIPMALQ